MLADLDGMESMIDSTLAFVRDDAQREPRMLVDLGALVESVCDNASDAGGTIDFSAERGVDVTVRPNAISRAVANLIDNAVKYGGSARRSRPTWSTCCRSWDSLLAGHTFSSL